MVTSWMYTRTFTGVFGDAEQAKALGFHALARLWIFGDAHILALLQNHAINLIMRKTIDTWTLPIDALTVAYENTLPGSSLRRLLIDLVRRTSSKILNEEQWPKEALLDLLRVVWWHGRRQVGKENLSKWDMCKYHVHEVNVDCKDPGGRPMSRGLGTAAVNMLKEFEAAEATGR